MAALRAELAELDERDVLGEEIGGLIAVETAVLSARMGALSARVDQLTDALAILQLEFDVAVELLETAIRFNVPVYFDFARDDLRPEDFPVLDRFGEIVSEFYPNALLTVEGFTDRAGSPEYNLALGQRRAEAVRLYLVEAVGLLGEQVRTVSYGEDPQRLVLPDRAGFDEGIENRRVVLVIEHLGMPMAF